jgi:4-hydroxy-2-oxoheptanedioate aldolase
MNSETNHFKRGIQAAERQIGLWSSLCSPTCMEINSEAGFDWILVDSEHAPVDVPDLMALLQAGSRGGTALVVRPAANDPVLLKRILDIGAQTVLVPYVQSVAEAEQAVASCRYAPAGFRGVSASTRAGRYGRAADYFARADDEVCVLVQVETGEAMARIAEITAVPGVDGVFIGPSDLAASMGHIGDPGHPDVQAAIRNGVQAIRAGGKAAGTLAPRRDDALRYLEWGFTFVAVGTDITLLVAGTTALQQSFRLPASVA